MVNLIALKPKPTSGDRGIALIPWLIRLWTQLRDAPTREWTSKHAGFWDQAVAGSSALKVALSRLVDDEIAQTLGTHTGCLYTDIKEFYDYLCLVKTLKAALDLGFPASIAVLSFSSYQGVRFLQGPDGCSLPLQATRGIITGDKNSNNFARAALYNLLETAHSKYTMVQTREWVDDLVQRMFGPVSRIQHHLGEAGLFVLKGLREAGFTISPKTTLVTTDRGLPTRLVQKYRTSGFPVHSALSAADLGIDRGFAARRRIPKHTKRGKNAWLRARKISRIARNLTSTRITRMLAVTGMLSSATYSSKLLGMAPSQLDRLRTATVNALMPRKGGRCRTTTLAIAMGKSEPGISVGVELVRSWLTWWSEHPQQHPAAKRTWNILHQRISHIPPTRRWRRVGGHLAAVITTLLDAGWNPHAATSWEDPDGNEWNMVEDGREVDFSPILSALAASLSSSLWSRAAQHWNGGGAEHGLDLRSLRLHLQSLWKRGKHEWFGMIHAISSASTWTRVRRHMTRPDSCPDAICRRCSTDEIETDFHRIWSCPANRNIDGIEKSQHLLDEACRHWEVVPSVLAPRMHSFNLDPTP